MHGFGGYYRYAVFFQLSLQEVDPADKFPGELLLQLGFAGIDLDLQRAITDNQLIAG